MNSYTPPDPCGPPASDYLLCTDLDGTLVDSRGRIDGPDLTALERARQAGVSVAFMTGRPAPEALQLLREADLCGIVAVSNGAALYDVRTGRALSPQVKLQGSEARNVLSAIDSSLPGSWVGADLGGQVVVEPDFVTTVNVAWSHVERADTREHIQRVGALKLLVATPNGSIDTAGAALHEALQGSAEVTRSTSHFLEVSPRAVDKGRALGEIARLLGIAVTSTAAIGDMPNDIPMLRSAALSAAPADAHPLVRHVADVVVASQADHAVASFVNLVLQLRTQTKTSHATHRGAGVVLQPVARASQTGSHQLCIETT